MRTSLICAATIAVLLAAPAHAQVLSLTEAQALQRFSPESPRVRVLRAQIELAQADLAAAGRFPNPRVTASREAVAGVAEDYFLVAQPLPVTGRRSLEIRAAEVLVRAATLRVSDLERRARAELRLAFTALVEQQAREQALAEAVTQLHELVRVLAAREATGDAAGFDRLRGEREVAEVEAQLVEAVAARITAQAALAGFFSPPVDPLMVRAEPSGVAPHTLPTVEALVARAEATRGELRAAREEIEAARLGRRVAERRAVPEPEIVAGVKTSNIGDGDRGSVLSVTASVPLFDRARPERARAETRERQAAAAAEVLHAQVRAEISALRQIVLDRRLAANAYEGAAAGRAGQLDRIALVSYEAGERGILELLDAYRSSAWARVRLAELRAAVARAEIELEFVAGWELVP